MIMKFILGVLSVLLLARSFLTSGIQMEGYERQTLTVNCSHTWAKGNRKYFCKDPCKDEDIVVDSLRRPPVRYQLQDKGNIFTVTITELRKSDSGRYWCAVDRFLADSFTEVVLTVLDVPTALPSSPTPSAGTRSPTTLSYLGDTSSTSQTTYPAATTNGSTANNKTADWRVYLLVSLGVSLLTSLVWILVYLALYYKETLQCFPRRQKASVSEGIVYENQNSRSHHPRPASTHTLPDYENVLNVAAVSRASNVYTVT